jgi:hypothetical protein
VDQNELSAAVADGLAYIRLEFGYEPIASLTSGVDRSRLQRAHETLQDLASAASYDSFVMFRRLMLRAPDDMLCTLGEGLVETWLNSNVDEVASWVIAEARNGPKWRTALGCVTLYEETLSHASSRGLAIYVYGHGA